MNMSTPDKPKAREPLSILFIGPPGGGKTTLAMQFPGVVFLDCDRNLDGPERYIRAQNKGLSYGYVSIVTNDKGEPVPVEQCFDRLMDQLAIIKNVPEAKVVVIDSLTQVNEFIIRKILAAQRRGEMEARDWIPFKSKMLDLIVGRLRGLGKTTICCVHESIITEADPKNIMNRKIVGYEPSIQGSIVDYFGGFFTDMWRIVAEPAPGDKVEYVICTMRTTRSDLKNSLNMPAKIVVKQNTLAWDAVKQYVEPALV